MSDNEVINRPHSPEESSGDESSSEVTNNGFSHDGEPVNRPRKVGCDGSAQKARSFCEIVNIPSTQQGCDCVFLVCLRVAGPFHL